MLVIYAVLLALQSVEPSILECVHIFLENAGSMKPIHQDFIQKIFGVRECCCHQIAGAAFGHVERKRKFFTRYEQIGKFSNRPTPWFQGWRPAADHACGIQFPVVKHKPWLRPRRFDHERGLRLAAYFYHPSTLLYHVPSFGGAEAFQRQFSQAAESSNGIPTLPWEKFVPDGPAGLRFVADVQKLSLQADVPSLAAMDRFAEANAELLRAENAFLIGDKNIPPFRVAHYKEMLKDAELDSWLGDVEEHVNDMCIASIVGNCFYPGALKVAIMHTSLQDLLKEDPRNHWRPLPLAQFLQCWQSYGQQILAATPGTRFQNKFSHKLEAPFPRQELNDPCWLKHGLTISRPVVLEYTPGQGKFQGISERASGIPKGISFVPETQFHRVQDLLQEKGIPSTIQLALQCVDPQLQFLCGSRRSVMASFCRESIASFIASCRLFCNSLYAFTRKHMLKALAIASSTILRRPWIQAKHLAGVLDFIKAPRAMDPEGSATLSKVGLLLRWRGKWALNIILHDLETAQVANLPFYHSLLLQARQAIQKSVSLGDAPIVEQFQVKCQEALSVPPRDVAQHSNSRKLKQAQMALRTVLRNAACVEAQGYLRQKVVNHVHESQLCSILLALNLPPKNVASDVTRCYALRWAIAEEADAYFVYRQFASRDERCRACLRDKKGKELRYDNGFGRKPICKHCHLNQGCPDDLAQTIGGMLPCCDVSQAPLLQDAAMPDAPLRTITYRAAQPHEHQCAFTQSHCLLCGLGTNTTEHWLTACVVTRAPLFIVLVTLGHASTASLESLCHNALPIANANEDVDKKFCAVLLAWIAAIDAVWVCHGRAMHLAPWMG